MRRPSGDKAAGEPDPGEPERPDPEARELLVGLRLAYAVFGDRA